MINQCYLLGLLEGLNDVIFVRSSVGLVNTGCRMQPQVRIQQVWSRALEFVFPARSQVPLLLVWDYT